MPITSTQTNNINQINVAMGGGIISDSARVSARSNPMLVIGLGGTGIDAALRVKHLVNKRFTLPDDGRGGKKDTPENVRFLGFETSVDDIKNKEFNGIRFDYTTEYIDISYPDLDIAMRNQNLYLTKDVKKWAHPELASKISGGTAGANGVRQGGRLMLHMKIDEIVNALDSIIRKMFEGKGENSRLEVFILSGISGGTGSGTFLDVPYIIRALMDRSIVSRGAARLDIMGYIFLPDVLISKPGLDPEYRDTIILNGYAAIKELDYMMNTTEPDKSFKERYGTRLAIDSVSPPFDLCHLVSATTTSGSVPQGAYSYAMGVAAEHIVNFMTKMEIKAGEAFDIHAYTSNLKTVSTAIRKRFPANYQYCILGASSLELPQEDILTYLAAKMLSKIEGAKDIKPQPIDRDKLSKASGIDIDFMHSDISSKAPDLFEGLDERAPYKPNNLARDRTCADEDYAFWKEEAMQAISQRASQMAGEVYKKLSQALQESFCDPAQGPYYVQNIIYSSDGNDLLSQISDCKREAKARQALAVSEQRQSQRNLEESYVGLCKAIIKTPKKRTEFLSSYKAYAEEWLKAEIYQRMDEIYTDLYNKLNNSYSQVYGKFADLLAIVSKTFKRNIEVLSETGEAKAYTRKIVSVSDKAVQADLDRRVSREDVNRFARTFYTRAHNEMSLWVEENSTDIAGFIGRIATEIFGDIATQTMDMFLIDHFRSSSQAQSQMEEDFMPDLASSSMPMFFMSAAGGQINLPTWSMVSVPKTGTIVKKAIKGLQDRNAFAAVQIAETDIENRVFWLNMKVGVPFYANDALEGYEEVYIQARRTEKFVGLHLYQNAESMDWSTLPSPISEVVWSDSYKGASRLIARENSHKRKAFDKAIELGLIDFNDNICTLYTRPDISIADIIASKPKAAEDALRAKSELERLITTWKKGSVPKRVPSLCQLVDLEGDVSSMYRESFLFYPKMAKLLEGEAEKLQAAKEALSFSQDKLTKGIREAEDVDDFAIACASHAIYKRGNSFVFYDTEESMEKELLHIPSLSDPIEQSNIEHAAFLRFSRLPIIDRACIKAQSDNALRADEKSIPIAMSNAERAIANRLAAINSVRDANIPNEPLESARSFYITYRDCIKRRLNAYSFESI